MAQACGFCGSLSLSLSPTIPSLAPLGPFTLAVVTPSTLGSSLIGAWAGAWLSARPQCVPLVVLISSHFGAIILGIILWEVTKVFYQFTTAVVRITENTDPALLDRRRPVFALPGRTYGGQGSPDRRF